MVPDAFKKFIEILYPTATPCLVFGENHGRKDDHWCEESVDFALSGGFWGKAVSSRLLVPTRIANLTRITDKMPTTKNSFILVVDCILRDWTFDIEIEYLLSAESLHVSSSVVFDSPVDYTHSQQFGVSSLLSLLTLSKDEYWIQMFKPRIPRDN